MNNLTLKTLKKYENYLRGLKRRFGFGEDDDCPICFESLNTGQICTNQCGHKFHCECIQEWMDMPGPAKTCPLCRSVIDIIEVAGVTPPTTPRNPRRNLLDNFEAVATPLRRSNAITPQEVAYFDQYGYIPQNLDDDYNFDSP
jgi:hypothetical protein